MSISEMSDQFDVLYNNITSNQAPGLNEYEKSLFLTKAQDEIVKNHFSSNSKGNSLQQGFDDGAKRQIDFSMLMKTKILSIVQSANIVGTHLNGVSKFYEMPSDIFVYINETLQVVRNGSTKLLNVVPLSYDEYARMLSKPYKYPPKNEAWRIINSGLQGGYTTTDYASIAAILSSLPSAAVNMETIFKAINGIPLAISSHKIKMASAEVYLSLTTGRWSASGSATNISTIEQQIGNLIDQSVSPSAKVVEIIAGSSDIISIYTVRYIAKPRPIILADLTDSLTINGVNIAQTSELDPILHEDILQRAVELAKIAWQGDVNTTMQSGQRSE